MAATEKAKDPVAMTIERLLRAPGRPGQAFTMPGVNYDSVYRTARRFKALFDGETNNPVAVCLCSDDRAVMAAALLASLAGGPALLIPPSLEPDTLADLHRRTVYNRAVVTDSLVLPHGVTPIDPATLPDAVESLTPDQQTGNTAALADRTWAYLSTGEPTGAARLASRTPRDLLTEAARLVSVYEIGSNDRILATVAPLHAYGLLYSVLVPLLATARVAASSPSSPAAIGRQMIDLSPTVLVSAPVQIEALTADPPAQPSLRLAFSSNGPLSSADRDAFRAATGLDVIAVDDAMPAGGDRETPPRAGGHDAAERHLVTFEPTGLKVAVEAGLTLQELAAAHGIDIRADCGGVGVCGKCRVLADPRESFSPYTDAELDVLTPDQMSAGSRLACQADAIGQGTVTIPEALADSAETRGKTGITGRYPLDPAIRRFVLDGRPPDIKKDNTPESLVDWLAAHTGAPEAASADAAALRRLSLYRDSLTTATVVVHAESGIRRILPGRQAASLGLAVDLGTTSIAGYLCDLETGAVLTADACVNPQRRFGEDVISRITRINADDIHLEELQRLAADGINVVMARCLAKIGATPADIDEVAVCGNTTMQQVFAGLHPHGLGTFPYFPLTLTPPSFSAGALNLAVDPAVPVFLMPVISGFVGGDTMGAILADRPHERDAMTLIVDIGTNGEVVLGNRETLWVTSCATGPALEGAQISCGMRAASGAIHRMAPDAAKRGVTYDVLGDDGSHQPKGVCGSGIIDAIATLRQIDVILPNGRLNASADGVGSSPDGIGRYFTVAEGATTATGSDIAITLKDVRQIQLAKGALCVGIEFLMRRAGIHRIDRTILTGAFGARFNWHNALAIGMLPPAVADGEVMPKDNLAGVGVVMALLDRKRRSEARALCRRTRYLELASEPDFAMAFARATAFPEIRQGPSNG